MKLPWVSGLALSVGCCVAMSGWAQAPAGVPEGWSLVYEQHFDSEGVLSTLAMSDRGAWRIGSDGQGFALELHRQSDYQPAVRSPVNVALVRDLVVGDFILEADLVQTGREYGHRDMCLFFGVQDPTHFYYVHLATAADDHAHNVFRVDGAPRVKFGEKTTTGVNWGLGVWHRVRLERRVSEGTVRVFFDDLTTPVMEATDRTFGAGWIGFGSFDDTGKVDNVRVWTPQAPERKDVPFWGRRAGGAAALDDVYLLGPDSAPQPGVPRGRVEGPETLASEVFPNTTRHYWVYVPAQYDGTEPACLMVFQDGHAFVDSEGSYRVPHVLDNLIYRREMPVTLAVFVNPGRLPHQKEASKSDWGDRINNRPTEYNELDDRYARLVVDELLPVLRSKYRISDRPEDRAIGGASSGAICAFTVAWHRPDQFRKVLSTIGSFTNIRGGHVYPDLVRQSERKPIRIFLQDGLNDNRGRRRGGEYDPKWDWHAQNRRMVEALTEKGYDVNFCWGIGTHSNKQGGAMLPEMLRWLWRDYPRPDDPADDRNRRLFEPGTP